jgi:hypothetical protein
VPCTVRNPRSDLRSSVAARQRGGRNERQAFKHQRRETLTERPMRFPRKNKCRIDIRLFPRSGTYTERKSPLSLPDSHHIGNEFVASAFRTGPCLVGGQP